MTVFLAISEDLFRDSRRACRSESEKMEFCNLFLKSSHLQFKKRGREVLSPALTEKLAVPDNLLLTSGSDAKVVSNDVRNRLRKRIK